MGLYAAVARPLLFRLDPERAHELAMASLAFAAPVIGGIASPPDGGGRLAQDLLGRRFANPIGLAAGFDKYAKAAAAWPGLGFGFAEIGTVTALPQEGNPRPRLHRLPDDRALINSLGFNNAGADATAAQLDALERRELLGRAPLGVNVGKSKVTPAAAAPADYARTVAALWRHADYVTLNVSSPNTPGLRDLQAAGPLGEILAAVDEANRGEAQRPRGRAAAGAGEAGPGPRARPARRRGRPRPGARPGRRDRGQHDGLAAGAAVAAAARRAARRPLRPAVA